jgi:hypothetical protein
MLESLFMFNIKYWHLQYAERWLTNYISSR